MKELVMCSDFLPKWERQNNAEVIDCIEGCLLDDLLYKTKRGVALLLETYVNEWTSMYTIHFYKNKDSLKAYDEWEKRIPEQDEM